MNIRGRQANDPEGAAGYNTEENLHSSAEQTHEKGLVSFGKKGTTNKHCEMPSKSLSLLLFVLPAPSTSHTE